jgi:hypothetical protein
MNGTACTKIQRSSEGRSGSDIGSHSGSDNDVTVDVLSMPFDTRMYVDQQRMLLGVRARLYLQ